MNASAVCVYTLTGKHLALTFWSSHGHLGAEREVSEQWTGL